MNREADFVAAIAASPGDELLFRAFADWLEEKGDHRAACVRSHEVRPWMGPRFDDPIPKLIDALKSKRRALAVRRAAAVVGAAMVPALVELLGHEDAYVRRQAIHCLRNLKGAAAGAVPALVAALKDPDAEVREQAARAIRDCGPKEVTDPEALRNSLVDANRTVRWHAAALMTGLGAGGKAVEHLVAQLGDPDPTVRLTALDALAGMKDRAVIAPICGALTDEHQDVRHRAAWHLHHLVKPGSAEAVEPLRAALADGLLRHNAANALGRIGPAAAAALPDLLRYAARRDAYDGHLAAIAALGEIAAGDGDVLLALERIARGTDERAALVAARAMGKWPSLPERIGEVFLALADRVGDRRDWDFEIAVAAVPNLERVTPAVIDLLRGMVRQGHYYHAGGPYLALMALGTRAAAAVPDLSGAVRQGNSQAAETLARMGEAGVAALVDLLDDLSMLCALTGLRQAGEAALPALPRLLSFLSGHPHSQADWRLMPSACEVIAAMGPAAADAAPVLLNLLGTDCDHAAVRALAGLGGAAVPHLPALLAGLRKSNRRHLYATAAEVLLNLAQKEDVGGPLCELLRDVAFVRGEDCYYRAQTRAIAAKALFVLAGRHGGSARAALPELLPLLTDPHVNARCAAVEAAGAIGGAEVVPGLRAALRDADEKVRVAAAIALGKAGAPSTAADLTYALNDASPRVRREAATALGKLGAGGEQTLAALRRAEKDADKAVRREAAAALRKIEGKRRG